MKLIVGLGNPGQKYEQNRHNVGFMFVDHIFQKLNLSSQWKLDKMYFAEIAKVKSENEELILVKPQTFMNDSGKAVNKILTNNPQPITNLVVVHDDLDIKLGEYKIQIGKGPKLHNGIESIENHLHTKEFMRVRIGVDNRDPANRISGEAYVLQNFSGEELSKLETVFEQILKGILNFK